MFPECQQNEYLWKITREAPTILSDKRKSILKRVTEEPLEEKIKKWEAKRPRKEGEENGNDLSVESDS